MNPKTCPHRFWLPPTSNAVYIRVCSMAEVLQVVPADRPAVITLHGLLGLVPFRFMIAADDKQERNLITASWMIPSFPAGCHESTQNGQKKKEAKNPAPNDQPFKGLSLSWEPSHLGRFSLGTSPDPPPPQLRSSEAPWPLP